MQQQPASGWSIDETRPVRSIVVRNLPAMIGIAFSGAGVGAIEALLLLLVVRVAALAADDLMSVSGLTLGPLDVSTVSAADAFLLGGIGVASMLALQAVAAYLETRTARYETVAARERLLDAYLDATWDVQSNAEEGALITEATTYIDRVQQVVTHVSVAVVAASSFLAMIAVAVFVNPTAALAIAVAGGVFGLVMRPLTRVSRIYSDIMTAETQRYVGEIGRLLRVRRELLVFDVRERMAERIDRIAREQARAHALVRFTVRMVPGLYRSVVLGFLFLGLGIVYGLDLENLSSLAAIVLILLRALNYTQAVQTKLQSLAESVPPLRRLSQRLEIYDRAVVPGGRDQLDRIDELELDHVHYSYDGVTEVLVGMSLVLRPGDVLGVVGASGAGKSTLVDLLVGLREPTRGTVRINARDAAEYDLRSRLRACALVPQAPQLLRGSIAENVRFLRDGIDDEAVDRALARALMTDVVSARGWEEDVGEHGDRLSGGQQQRIGLARALVDDPSLLVLDEPTSALDIDSERRIVEQLGAIREGRITVIISHRPEALAGADRLLVMRPSGRHTIVDSDELPDLKAFVAQAVGEEHTMDDTGTKDDPSGDGAT